MPNFHGKTDVVELIKAAQAAPLTLGGEPLQKGDAPGHPFRGNQYSDAAEASISDRAWTKGKEAVDLSGNTVSSPSRAAHLTARDANEEASRFHSAAHADAMRRGDHKEAVRHLKAMSAHNKAVMQHSIAANRYE